MSLYNETCAKAMEFCLNIMFIIFLGKQLRYFQFTFKTAVIRLVISRSRCSMPAYCFAQCQ